MEKIKRVRGMTKISPEKVEEFWEGTYEVKTIIPGKPSFLNTRILTRMGLDKFLNGYNEDVEFLISIKKIEE